MRHTQTLKRVSGLAVVVLAAFLFAKFAGGGPVSGEPVNQPAPSWELKNVDGQSVAFSEFKGKVVILDFWATWCPPCVKEIPGFIELQKEYGEKGLAVVGVSMDQQGARVVEPFMKKHQVNYTMLIGDYDISEAFGGIRALPTTFVIDRSGTIVSKHVGYVPKEQFEKEIKPLLSAKPSTANQAGG